MNGETNVPTAVAVVAAVGMAAIILAAAVVYVPYRLVAEALSGR